MVSRSVILAFLVFASLDASAQRTPRYEPVPRAEIEQLAADRGLSSSRTIEFLEAHEAYLAEVNQSEETRSMLWNWHISQQTPHAPRNESSFRTMGIAQSLGIKWSFGVREVEIELYEALRAIAPEQRDAIDAAERARRRQRIARLYYLGSWPVHIPFMDVVTFTRATIRPDERTEEVDKALLEYEEQFDPLAVSIDEAMVTYFSRSLALSLQFEKLKDQDPSDHELRRLAAPYVEVDSLVYEAREVNRRALERLADLVSPTYREQFQLAHQEHFLRSIVAESEAFRRRVESALESDDLSGDDRGSIESIRDRYLSERAGREGTLYRQALALGTPAMIEQFLLSTLRPAFEPQEPNRRVYEWPPSWYEFERNQIAWRERIESLDAEFSRVLNRGPQ